ncbi:hypothetical protein WG922_04620 [Ramlibacter sp. AN1015]|uniref:hypothetical protein n=1 Tax=Ramlibacter sp. AN1015 TaxID=3133428 RepID=UPI0030BDBD0F
MFSAVHSHPAPRRPSGAHADEAVLVRVSPVRGGRLIDTRLRDARRDVMRLTAQRPRLQQAHATAQAATGALRERQVILLDRRSAGWAPQRLVASMCLLVALPTTAYFLLAGSEDTDAVTVGVGATMLGLVCCLGMCVRHHYTQERELDADIAAVQRQIDAAEQDEEQAFDRLSRCESALLKAGQEQLPAALLPIVEGYVGPLDGARSEHMAIDVGLPS